MKRTTRQAADQEWKQLTSLGEWLVHQPDPALQCEHIAEVIGQLLSAEVRVWLAAPAYPLPGGAEVQTLPEAQAGPLVLDVYARHNRQSSSVIAQDQPSQNSGEPHPEADRPTAIAAPMLVSGDLLGVVEAKRSTGAPFSNHEHTLLDSLITHAAIAMEVTRQETLKNWRLEQLNLVRSASAQIANLTSLEELYTRVTQLIRDTFGYYYVAIFAMDEQKNILRFRGSASRNDHAPLRSDFWIHLGEGIIGTVAESGAEIKAPDVRQESHYLYLDLLPETRSEAALPLKIENRILGVLDVQSDKLHAFHETDMLALRTLADNIAVAIESTRLYDSLQRRAEQISSVFEVSHALTSILDVDQLLNEIVQLIQNRFGYPFVHLYTINMGLRMVMYRVGTGERSEAMKQQGRHYPLEAPMGLIPWVARNGKTFVANDVSLEPLYLPSDVPPLDTRAEMVVPLIAGDEVLGVLDIQSRSVNAFDENDRSLFEALAAPIAAAIRNANLYRSEQWRRRVAESFRDVAHLISSNMPLDDLLAYILEKLEHILPCDLAAVWLLHEEGPGKKNAGSRLRLAATRKVAVEQIFEVVQELPVLEVLDRALQSEHPLIRKADDPIGPLGAAMDFSQEYSSIAAPLRTGKRVLGLLTLAHHSEGRYGNEAQAITATFASYAAVAIQNARLYSESQEQALISTMLLQVAEASQSTLNINELLETMLRLTRLLMGVRKCAFLLWDDLIQSFQLQAWYGFEPLIEAGQPRRSFSANLPALRRLAAERVLLTLDDPGIELDMPELRLNPGTVLTLPLMVRGELLGAFLVGLQMAADSDAEQGFDPKAQAILQGIAHQTSVTVDNLRLLEARQEEAYVTAALLQVAQAVVTSTDLNDTLDTIVHLLPILVGVETCIIYLWDATSQLFRPTQVSAPSRREEEMILARPFSPAEHNLLDTVRRESATYMCAIPSPYLSFESWGALEVRHYQPEGELPAPAHYDWVFGYPLILQGQVLGALIVREMNASPVFWERRLEIINGIAQQVSMAIQNDLLRQEMAQAERIEREMLLARQIQETFLPDTLPQAPGWEMDVRWETAREIGGDFYDLFRLDEHRMGLAVADVADKGLPAALYMTVTRTLIRAAAVGNDSPAAVLKEVNSLLVNESSESMFVTAVYAVLRLDTGEVLYANAGHNLPLFYHCTEKVVQPLPKGGMALGVMEPIVMENHRFTLQHGDALILYTDGVTDLQSPEGAFFGELRLREVFRTHGQEPVQNILEEVDDAMIAFRRGTPSADDITMLAIRRLPEDLPKPAALLAGAATEITAAVPAEKEAPATPERKRRRRSKTSGSGSGPAAPQED